MAGGSGCATRRDAGLSRRELLGGAAAAGLTAVLAAPARGQAPRRGGHLILGLENASSGDTLDPGRLTGRYIIVVGLQLYDMLVDVDEQLRTKAALAESWAAKPGAREWVFKLRRGVTFHNGKELTAADVVYSLNHHRGADSKSAAKSLMAAVTDVKATGKHEVTFTLENGNADLPYVLGDYHLGIVPEGTSFTAGVGTGAFVLEAFQAGVRARTKRNPNDWRSESESRQTRTPWPARCAWGSRHSRRPGRSRRTRPSRRTRSRWRAWPTERGAGQHGGADR
jgi:peptide/nickel transport system substrate-binding protein